MQDPIFFCNPESARVGPAQVLRTEIGKERSELEQRGLEPMVGYRVAISISRGQPSQLTGVQSPAWRLYLNGLSVKDQTI